MKKLLVSCLLVSMSIFGVASGGIVLDVIEVDASDKASLRSGAELYMDYCMSCHSLEYARYNRVARDLDISEGDFTENLMHLDANFGDLMDNAVPAKQAKAWFGTTPPDLTLVAKLRGSNWLYSYLRGFYADESRPWGVNNVVFEDVGMPHVMLELQGLCAVEPVIGAGHGDESASAGCSDYLVEGSLSSEEYDAEVHDLVNFLAYMADPGKLNRESLGWMVFIFLGIFFVVSYLYTRELHKDIH